MISKCANPECGRPFRYLREGKVFRVDLDLLEITAHSNAHPEKPGHRLEHFWLCGQCSETMTLVAEKGRGVSIARLSQLPKAS